MAAELHPIGRYEWERLIRRAALSQEVKFLALVLGTYADPDGTRVRPGAQVLAAVTGKSERTVRRLLRQLTDTYGLLEQVARGGGRNRRGHTSVYRLTIPSDLLDRVELLHPNEMGRHRPDTQMSGETDGSPATQVTDGCGQSPVDNSDPPDTTTAGQSSMDEPIDRSSSDTFSRLTGHLEPIDRSPRCPTTTHRPTTTDHPLGHLPAQPQTARKAADDEHESISATAGPADVPGGSANDAINRTNTTGRHRRAPPDRCRHGLSAATTDDGRAACALCRRTNHPTPEDQ